MADLRSSGGEQPAIGDEYSITITYHVRTHYPIKSTGTLEATVKDQAQKLSNQVLNSTWPDAECIGVNVVRKDVKQSPEARPSRQHGSDASHPPPKDSQHKEHSPVGRSKDNPGPDLGLGYPQAAQNGFQRDSDASTPPLIDTRCRSKDNQGPSPVQNLVKSTRNGFHSDSNTCDPPSKGSPCEKGRGKGGSRPKKNNPGPQQATPVSSSGKRKRSKNEGSAESKKKRDLKVQDAVSPAISKQTSQADLLVYLIEQGMAVILDDPGAAKVWEDNIEQLKPSYQTSQRSQDFGGYSTICRSRGWLAEFMRLCALQVETIGANTRLDRMRGNTRLDRMRGRKIVYTVFELINKLFVHSHIGARAFHIIAALAALENSHGINAIRTETWEVVDETVEKVAARVSAFPRWDEVPLRRPLDPVELLANDRRKREYVRQQLGLRVEPQACSEATSSSTSTETPRRPEETIAQVNLGPSPWARPPTSQQAQSPETIAGALEEKERDYWEQQYSGQNAVADKTNPGEDSNSMDTTSLQDLQVEPDWESFIHPGLLGFADLGWNLLHEDIS
ncbi:hypothetical protein LTR37_021551, partial [Vermiconidia calcicola]